MHLVHVRDQPEANLRAVGLHDEQMVAAVRLSDEGHDVACHGTGDIFVLRGKLGCGIAQPLDLFRDGQSVRTEVVNNK